ncbi:hypothetical protein [Lactiplantibacillus carotarum]|uniref:hypothetical protein n=1 Tax=Lactiplantibacillus carotarum TaxID=2993456 RepID=UPI00298F2D3B|nr:hypothetical protein [Lactiplantibacillus carotarum]
MTIDVDKYYGKSVALIDIDNQTFIGFVQSVDEADDEEDGIASINLINTEQFPADTVDFKINEIKSIKIIGD